ncbi:hypothetical protein A3A59_04710 [Candidatus Gottesmanbacteria bacterium RIFCSPLOWO2_01_FULL_42_10]|nr:MAG: hypothetical protein A3A59_04710 [Candidatus Gottesmanbacteria bacterium RIFCSPLOWO2_01_FULL_42_10]
MKPHIILASASIGRKTLLQKLGVPFSIQVSAVDEDKIVTKDPYKMLALRARAKAEDVATKIIQLSNSQINTNYPIEKNTRRYTLDAKRFLIIAADSMAILGNKTFGKARDKRHAKTIVQALNGRTHDFVTGTTIIHLSSVIPGLTGNLTKKDPRFREDDKFVEINRWENISTTRVTCRQMTESEIERYTSRYNFRKFAAAYALNETPWNWITKIDGSYTNVIGLPFEVVLPIFKDLKLI